MSEPLSPYDPAYAEEPPRPSHRTGLIIMVVGTLFFGAVFGGIYTATRHRPAPAPPPSSARQIAMFDSGVPGTRAAHNALAYAKRAKIDAVVNYSVLNAPGQQIDAYLRDAAAIGVKVIVSLKDLLGPDDLDPKNAVFHRQFGQTTGEQVRKAVPLLEQYPAVGGYFISDELPEEPGPGEKNANIWLPRLAERYAQVRSLTAKPILSVFYYYPGRQPFLRQMQTVAQGYTGTQDLMVDFYPFPDPHGSGFAPIAACRQAGRDLKAVAGNYGWFVLQAFSWNRVPDIRDRYGFGPNPPAPSAQQMTHMAQLALAGGAFNLALYYYPWIVDDVPEGADPATSTHAQEVIRAVAQIRALPEFQSTS